MEVFPRTPNAPGKLIVKNLRGGEEAVIPEKQTPNLPEGWSIRPVGKQMGLFREGRKSPVAKAQTAEELTSKIAIPKAKAAPIKAETAPKSKGHLAFVGKHEYYRGANGKVFKATLGSKISAKTGNRTGTLSSEGELGKHQAKEAVKAAPKIQNEPAPASAGQPPRTAHTAPPADTPAEEDAGAQAAPAGERIYSDQEKGYRESE